MEVLIAFLSSELADAFTRSGQHSTVAESDRSVVTATPPGVDTVHRRVLGDSQISQYLLRSATINDTLGFLL